MTRRELGKYFEDKALEYLQTKNFTLLENNFSTHYGELDLVMRDGEFIVFVEVKSLKDSNDFSIYETLTKTKKRRLKSTISSWLFKNNFSNSIWRFDFVGIVYKDENDFNIEHFEFVSL